MKVPTVGSVIKVRMNYDYGPFMIPPQPDFVDYEGKVVPSYKWLTDQEFCMSGDNMMPIRVINVNSIRDLKISSGSVKEIDTKEKVIEVKGSKGQVYFVSRTGKGYQCTCPGFQFRKSCKHIAEFSS